MYDVTKLKSLAVCRTVQIVRRGLARILSIDNNVESDLLSLVERTHASAFDRADVHEDILAAIIRLDEAEAFLVIEELHGSSRHITVLSGTCVMRPRVSAAGSFGEKSSVRRGMCGEAKSFGRSSIIIVWVFFSWTARLIRRSLEKKLAIWLAPVERKLDFELINRPLLGDALALGAPVLEIGCSVRGSGRFVRGSGHYRRPPGKRVADVSCGEADRIHQGQTEHRRPDDPRQHREPTVTVAPQQITRRQEHQSYGIDRDTDRGLDGRRETNPSGPRSFNVPGRDPDRNPMQSKFRGLRQSNAFEIVIYRASRSASSSKLVSMRRSVCCLCRWRSLVSLEASVLLSAERSTRIGRDSFGLEAKGRAT